MKTKEEPPGRAALMHYRIHGGGMALLTAYSERRAADAAQNDARKAQLIKMAEAGTSPEEHGDITAELLMLHILDELDPIVSDLLKFCRRPGKTDDQLPNLRSALRIGKGKAPSDTTSVNKRLEVEQRWIALYLHMDDTGEHKSETALKKDVAKTCGVSESTALNRWRALKLRAPLQAKWASEIENRLRPKSDGHEGETKHQARKKKTAKRQRIEFGKRGASE